MWFLYSAISMIIGFLLDMIIGDPHWKYHPICIIGNMISFFERHLRKYFPKNERGERTAGIWLTVIVCTVTAIVTGAVTFVAYSAVSYKLFIVTESLMCYFVIAANSLKKESMKVGICLKNSDMLGARESVSMIVGRDTQFLDEEGVIKATVETVAENTSDGVIAPLFYTVLGGGCLAFVYKAINTMDSMVGYKNEKYVNFGWAAAKLDDVVNFIPSRISAVLMIAATFVSGLDWKNAIRIFKRDRFNHTSPNSAQTESVCAGALDVRLAGDAYYFGKLYKKPFIGDSVRELRTEDISRVNKLMYISAVFMLFMGVIFKTVMFMGCMK